MSQPNPLDFNELAASNRDGVYRQMLRLCGNREDAEDVLIDALLVAYRKMDSLREREAFGRWLSVIARRLCFDLRSREKIRNALSLSDEEGFELADDAAKGPHEQLMVSQLRGELHRTIDSLPPEMREVYVMRDLDEKSGEETAAALGISLAAMKSRLHRARTLVRQRMDTALFGKEDG